MDSASPRYHCSHGSVSLPDAAFFAPSVVTWQREHGRHHLPWQHSRDPYRVWLSEVMLQQTQVATVLAYYERFLARFPDVAALAAAPDDEVLALWSGLGYYSRARNLHKAAQMVMELHAGHFPHSAAQLAQLPGIGRSTAAAIAAFCFDERVPILDANVRRVLTRYLAFDADLARPANEKALWLQAEQLLPGQPQDMPAYTQGLMDLGATVCLASRPSCLVCPLAERCRAKSQGQPEKFPVRTRTLKRRTEVWWLLVLHDAEHRVWLEKRPAPGIWAGLKCPPVFVEEAALGEKAARIGAHHARLLPVVRHALTHRDLVLTPVLMAAAAPGSRHADTVGDGEWAHADQWTQMGLPAPIRALLTELASQGPGFKV